MQTCDDGCRNETGIHIHKRLARVQPNWKQNQQRNVESKKRKGSKMTASKVLNVCGAIGLFIGYCVLMAYVGDAYEVQR